jgi:serine/threonine protein kinase/tetratricopeptide (TPR) repeat protein
MATQEALFVGAVIAETYRVTHLLGRGGTGAVWAADHLRLPGRHVAVKVLLAPGVASGEALARFRREAEIASRLGHPHIVQVLDFHTLSTGEPYIVLELLHGETLAERLRSGPLSLGEALAVARQVGSALQAAHWAGVVHRDLKPDNIFLCAIRDETPGPNVKVLDFGISKIHGSQSVATLDAVLIGTPQYMAPEQALGRNTAIDARTDGFALGAIVYEMLSGVPAFGGSSLAEVVYKVVHTQPQSLAQLRPGLPVDVLSAVDRSLQKDPALRPRDVSAFVAELTGKPLTVPDPATRRAGMDATLAGPAAPPLSLTDNPSDATRTAATPMPAGGAHGLRPAALESPASPASIAVLPFADLSPGHDQEFFSEGVAEEILNALTKVDGLRVSGRASSFRFKGTTADPADIARKLGVAHLLTGSVRRSGSQLRISAEVVRATDGEQVWRQTFDRSLTEVFAVQDEIAAAVVDSLRAKLLPGERPGSASESLSTQPEAYASYLFGRQLFHLSSPEGYRRAVEAYGKAIEIDPRYAPAWAGLAITASYASNYAKDGAEFAQDVRRSEEAGDRAGELAPDLAEALAARGYCRAVLRFDWSGAEADLAKAVRLSPRVAEFRRIYGGLVFFPQGRQQEAEEQVRRSTELDPGSALAWSTLGLTLVFDGHYAQAQFALEEALRLSPDQSFAALNLVRALVLQGKGEQARDAAGRTIAPGRRLTGMALAQHALGNDAEARAALRVLGRDFADRTPYQIAVVYAALDDRAEALRWLEQALSLRDRELVIHVRCDPFLRELRSEVRYLALLRKMNLSPT